MAGVIAHLKAQARLLHRQAQAGDPQALARVRRADAALTKLDDTTLRTQVQRRHGLAALARELGFDGWPHAARVLAGDEAGDEAGRADFGTLLYPPGADVHWNVWSADYDEARRIREQHGGYLLAYRRHFFIADRHFVATLGLDPDDPDWARIGRDWVRPHEGAARERLYARVIGARQAAS